MKSLVFLIILKIISFIGGTLNTVGFLTFFFFENLKPYRWQMIISGLILIALAEGTAYLLAKKMAKSNDE